MTSRQVLILHTTIFCIFLTGSLASPFLARFYPEVFASSYYLPAVVLLMILVLSSWKKYGGCPFTVWEKRLWELEKKQSAYIGSCLTHYTLQWLGWKIPSQFFTALLLSLFILPVTVGIYAKYLI